jgi:hypothetical protein
MAKVTGPLHSMTASGKLGGALSFLGAARGAVVRSITGRTADAAAGRKRPPTPLQEQVRARWSSGVAAWHALTPENQSALTAEAMPLGLTGYNLFMRRYTPPAGTAWDGGSTTWDAGATHWDN